MSNRCAVCGRFARGPFIVVPTYGDSSEPTRDYSQIGWCCQSDADREGYR